MDDPYAATPNDRFSFGLWTVGHRGGDPFGLPTRPPIQPEEMLTRIAEVGAWGVSFHDDDLVPFGSSAADRDRIVASFGRAVANAGLCVSMTTVNLFFQPVFKDGALTAADPAGTRLSGVMVKQQRTMRVEQRSQLAAMQQMESRSDEELEAETKFKAAAQAILGARAAERYDAKAARAHFQRAIAAARPQERLQLRRMADASLALAERRADDLKKATERLGVEAPTNRQLLGLKFMGLVAPPSSAGKLARIRGILIVIALIVGILLLGFGIVSLIALPFGLSLDLRIFWGLVLVFVAIGGLVFYGRRRQRKALADRAEQAAARSR